MTEPRPSSSGLALAIGAYGLWGFLPVYFLLLAPSGPIEIVAWRILLSLVFCGLLIAVMRGASGVGRLVRDPRILKLSLLAGILIAVNWHVYLYASLNGFIVEAALGYFINPIVTVALGVVLLRERLRPGQWAAVGISLVAVIVLAVGYGELPWISLVLAFSFGFYGYVKNRMGPAVTPVGGLTLETAWLVPIAVAELVWVASLGGGITLGQQGAGHAVLLALAGVVTAVPLLLFAAAARRLPLSVMGFVQYFAPLLQFAFGVFVMGEPMPPERWAGFALVWVALVVLTAEAIRHRRRSRAPQPAPMPETGPVTTV
ncbi:EamA family transporter RarD [Microcella daejeonensis]|uniref:EamA family transporter RarD n=1 Tax=Microcella daejeonensis TaxID=2994971 RepID=A0A9E8MIR1_9MICO|nr:EamA family transporter RarD [Microcella daejeonensis]WAB80291.1 EamA family transporter RarD [Microcella daejeonensis]